MFLSSSLRTQFESIPDDWFSLLQTYITSTACDALCKYIDQARAKGQRIYPQQVFQALHLTSVAAVKVIILGQDPYHGVDRLTHQIQAHGLAFSVPPGVYPPPSLRNIFQEIHQDLKLPIPSHGYLATWAKQGVLLLNTILTVEAEHPASHAHLLNNEGWEKCTDILLKNLAQYHTQQQRRLIIMLWGTHARTKATLFTEHHATPKTNFNDNGHIVLQASHPSPLSAHRGFFGCHHFSLANQALIAAGQAPINWGLPDIGTIL